MYHRAPECWNVADRFSDFARSDKNFSAADCYRTRRAQNRRSQFPQRYCLIDTNLNNLSSKSRRRERLIRLLLQSGHVITRKCLYSLIGRSKYPNSAYVVPSDETSIRACIKPQILSFAAHCAWLGIGNHRERVRFTCAGGECLAPLQRFCTLGEKFLAALLTLLGFTRITKPSLPIKRVDNYGSTKHQRRSRLHSLFVHLGPAGTPRCRSHNGAGSSVPAPNPPQERHLTAGGAALCPTPGAGKLLKITFDSIELHTIRGGIFDALCKTLDVAVLVDMALTCQLPTVA